jgi:hypothetical protein
MVAAKQAVKRMIKKPAGENPVDFLFPAMSTPVSDHTGIDTGIATAVS